MLRKMMEEFWILGTVLADPGGGGGVQGVRTKLFLESGVKFTGNALYF